MNAHHLKHRPAARRRGIQPLLVQVQIHALGVEFAQTARRCFAKTRNTLSAKFGA